MLFDRYLVTIILDCTVGLLLTCIMISYIDKLFSRLGKEVTKCFTVQILTV